MPNTVDITITSTDKTKPGVDSATANVKKLGDAVSSTGSVFKGVLAADQLQEASRRVAEFVNGSIKAASDLEQAVGGTEAVFKEASDQIGDFAKKSAQTVGLSENDFRNFTTLIGGQLKRMTGDLDFAADKSIELAKVAADLSATYGGTTKEAMEAFSAALRGEADPAERFNLNLKVSAVQAKAVEMGLAKSVLTVSDAAKAQATYALILEQSQDALGQFNRENDSAAHKQQVATAEIENAKAALGQGLLPIYASAASAVGALAKGFGDLPKPVQESITAIVGLGAAYAILAPKIVAAKVATKELGITMAGTRAFIAGPWGLAIAGAIALIAAFTMSQKEASARVNELASSLDFQKGALDENNRQVIAAKLEEAGLLKLAKELNVNTETLTSAILGDAAAREQLNLRTINLNKNSTEATVKQKQFNDAVSNMIKDTDAASTSQSRKTAATKTDTQANVKNTDSIQDQIDAMVKQAKLLQDQFDPMAKLIHTQQAVTEAQAKYSKAVKEHGAKSEEAKQANIDLAEAVLEMGVAATTTGQSFNGKLDPAMRAVLKAGGLTEKQIKDIEKQFIAAKKAGDAFAGTYNATANLTVKVKGLGSIRFDAEGNPTRHASGGIMGGGLNSYNPGEEIARFPSGTTVLPRGASQQMLNNLGGMGGTQKLQLEVIAPRATGVALLDALIEGIRYKVGTEGANDPATYLKR